MFRIVITGSRGWSSWDVLYDALSPYVELYGSDSVQVIHGDARGADKMAAWTAKNKLGVTNVLAVPAEWDKYGRGAGMKRNREMLEMLDANDDGGIVLAFWDGQSKGTKNTIDTAKQMGLPCRVYSTSVVMQEC